MKDLATSVEAGRIASAERYFEERTCQPSFTITPSFQEYDVTAHNCQLQNARPWTKEALQLFGKANDILCIQRIDEELDAYRVIGTPCLSEKKLHDLLLAFVA